MNDVIEGTAVEEPGTEIVLRPAMSPTLFNTDDPAEVVARATRTAEPLAQVVRKQGLAVNISGREHVKVEGWTLLGSMLGVFPVCTWTRKLDNGWEARVEARTIGGALVGAAEAECLRSESKWTDRDDYALRSMAQTRATSKALRQPLGFVMQLAGFEATPAEEMPTGGVDEPKATENQLRYLRRLMDERGLTDVGAALDQLTKAETSKLIEDIKAGTFVAPVVADEVCGECGGVNDHAETCSERVPF